MFKQSNFNLIPSTNLEEIAIAQRFNQALPEINLDGLSLRQLQAEDLPIWFNYLRNELVRESISWDVKHERELLNFLDYEHGTQRKWALVDEQNRLIGTGGFHSINLDHNSCEVAYDISPEYWGKSYATELCKTLSDWAHKCLNMKRISATVMVSNTSSKRVLEKSGYHFEGIMRSYRQVRGRYPDYFLFSSIAE